MIHVLHHSDSDGFFAGYCAWRHYREALLHTPEHITFYKVQYNQPFPIDVDTLTADDTVFVLDFSYTRDILDPVYAKVKELVVLDHHETAQEYLLGCPYAIFDMTKSGALLAWEYFFPGQNPPQACLLVNDRDLWQWKFKKYTSAFEAWLWYDSVGQDWEKWHRLSTCSVAMEEALDKGMLLHEKLESELASFLGNPNNFTHCEDYLEQLPTTHKRKTKFILYNGNYTSISELAQAFYTAYPGSITIDYRVRKKIVTFSIRSPSEELFNAKQYAMAMGGGGHPKSASFSLPRKEAFDYIEYLHGKEVVPA